MITFSKGTGDYGNTVKIDFGGSRHFVSPESSVYGDVGTTQVVVADVAQGGNTGRNYKLNTLEINGRPSDDGAVVAEWLRDTYFQGMSSGSGGGLTDYATATNQTTMITELQEIEADIEAGNTVRQNIHDKQEAGLVSEDHDYIKYNYTGTGLNKQLTSKVYKTGGAAGTTVATVTYAYDGDGDVDSKTKT
jgi:putative IMPACT (imprinted ancient) family translation regulator